MPTDLHKATTFLESLFIPDAASYAFSNGGSPSLYGTCFALMGRHFLDAEGPPALPAISDFIRSCQEPSSGYFIGPDLESRFPSAGDKFSREHLIHHLTCHVLPTAGLFQIPIGPLIDARKFIDPEFLENWLDQRDMTDAWLEGNNLLFVGQMLWHLREHEQVEGSAAALEQWFSWLDRTVDPATGLWGTNNSCSPFNAMCGGYHQLLVYYFENRPLPFPERLIDTVLSLQHPDGGFHPNGGGGACEDVDAVDILVNLYKRHDYRRGHIRAALRRAAAAILAQQNPDGGFPYNHAPQDWIYMRMPNTKAAPGQSHAFGTWFRIHTLALIAEVVDHPALIGIDFQFNRDLSMGWHRKWTKEDKYRAARTGAETGYRTRLAMRQAAYRFRKSLGRVKRRLSGK